MKFLRLNPPNLYFVFLISYLLLSRISPVLQLPWEKEFGRKDQQEAYARGGNHLDKEVDEGAKVKPFEQYQVGMVHQGKHNHINCIGCPAHSTGGRFPVIEFGGILRNKDRDHKWSGISN